MCPKTVYSYILLNQIGNQMAGAQELCSSWGGGRIPSRGVTTNFCLWGTDSAVSNPPTPQILISHQIGVTILKVLENWKNWYVLQKVWYK